MGFFGSAASITRYRVDGSITSPVLETVQKALHQYTIAEIDGEPAQQAYGWTSLDNPFQPDFETDSFVIGSLFVFSLRVDKKQVSAKVIKKHLLAAVAEKLRDSARDHLSRSEKQTLKEKVITKLCMQIPSTPTVYDLIWDMEASSVGFFANQKAVNEILETLFNRSFNVNLIRLFPYTLAYLDADLDEQDKERIAQLSPTRFAAAAS